MTLPVFVIAFANDRRADGAYLRNLPEEKRQIEAALERVESAGLCEVVTITDATPDDIFRVFLNPAYAGRIAVFHYAGHADNYRLFLQAADGNLSIADGRGLAAMLGTRTGIQLVFLNACSTRPQVDALLSAGVGAVIATSQAIRDDVATGFATRFYQAIAAGNNIGVSFQIASAEQQTKHGGDPRGVYVSTVDEQPVPEATKQVWPWGEQPCHNEGAARRLDWNLADAVKNPLFFLPELPNEIGVPKTPYRSINYFEKKDARVFFGRGYEIYDLYTKLTAEAGAPVVLYHGQSGVGKSSLLAAGLLPRLERKSADKKEAHAVVHERRQHERGLLGTLVEMLNGVAARNGIEPVQIVESDDAAKTGSALRQMWLALEARIGRTTLLLDQAEEAYTRTHEGGEKEVAQLAAALATIFHGDGERPQGRFVLSFRKEWFADISKVLSAQDVDWVDLFLKRLDRDGIEEAIEGPAREEFSDRFHLTIEKGLARQIADDLLEDAESAIAPVLQILLVRMWEATKPKKDVERHFTTELYVELKREGFLLADFLNKQMETLETDLGEVATSGLAIDVLAYHTTDMLTAQERTRTELEEEYAHRKDALDPLLKRSRELYLLTDMVTNSDAPETATRLTHDTLAPLVHKMYEASPAPGQKARRILDGRESDWKGGDETAYLNDGDLARVEAGLAGTRALREYERAMVEASREKQEQEAKEEEQRQKEVAESKQRAEEADRQREEARRLQEISRLNEENARQLAEAESKRAEEERMRAETQEQLAEKQTQLAAVQQQSNTKLRGQRKILGVVGTLAALAAIVAAVFWYQSFRQGQELAAAKSEVDYLNRAIRADQLTFTGLRIVDSAPELALLLGIEGVRAQNDFMRAVPHTFTQVSYDIAEGSLITTTSYLTVETVAASAQENLRTLLDTVDSRIVLKGKGDSEYLAVSPDGRWLATEGRRDGMVRLWDLGTDDPLQSSVELIGHKTTISTVSFSPDGRWLATGDHDAIVHVWDMDNEDPSQGSMELIGHRGRGWINTIVFSPNGRWIATENAMGEWQLWDMSNEDSIDSVQLTGNAVSSLAFSPDGRWLATGGNWNGDAFLRDLDSTDLSLGMLPLIEPTDNQTNIVFSPDERWLAIGEADGPVRLWNMGSLGQGSMALLGHADRVRDLVFSPDGRWFATRSADGTALLWDMSSEDPIHSSVMLSGHGSPVDSVIFSPEGQRIATWSDDGTARLWDLSGDDSNLNPVMLAEHESPVNSVTFSPEGRWIAAGADEGSVHLWDLSRKDLSQGSFTLAGHTDLIRSVAFSPGERWLATGSSDGTARLWDLSSKDPNQGSVALTGDELGIWAVAFSKDERWLVAASGDSTTRLWDLGREYPPKGSVVLTGHGGSANSVAFSPDGRWLVIGFDDGIARLWDMSSAGPDQDLVTLVGHTGGINAVAFSPDGRWLATGSLDGTARLWDMSSGDPSQGSVTLTKQTDYINAAAFSPNGRWLATGSEDGTVRLWDMRSTDPSDDPVVLTGHAGPVKSLAFRPDGQLLATGSLDGTTRVWDISSDNPDGNWEKIGRSSLSDSAVAFSPDGKWLAVASDDYVVLLERHVSYANRDLYDGASWMVTEHEDSVTSVSFSADGRWLASGSKDNTVHLWDVSINTNRQTPLVLTGNDGWFSDVAFSPMVKTSDDMIHGSRWLATASADGTVRLWPLRIDELISMACARIGRNMTAAEWQQYMSGNPLAEWRQAEADKHPELVPKTCEEWPAEPWNTDAVTQS